MHDVIIRRDYKEKYYKSLMPLGLKYAEVLKKKEMLSTTILSQSHVDFNTDFMQLLPWGGKLTSESLRFFSPIVIWTKFTSSQYKHDVLYSAFMDYYKV